MNIFKKRTPSKEVFSEPRKLTESEKFFSELERLNPWAHVYYKIEPNMLYVYDFDFCYLTLPNGYRLVEDERLFIFTNGDTFVNIKLFG